MSLPECDELFMQFFDRWYSDDDRERKVHKATRPDMMTSHTHIGKPVERFRVLSDEFQSKVQVQISRMVQAAECDWPNYLAVKKPLSIKWIELFDSYYDESRVEELISKSDPTDFSNDLLVVTSEFGAVLGAVMKTLQPRLQWHYEWPYWESALWDSKSGNIIPCFHWAVKKMSSYGIDDGFSVKLQVAIY